MDQQKKKKSSKDNFNSRNVNEEQLGRFFSLEKSSGKTLLWSRTEWLFSLSKVKI